MRILGTCIFLRFLAGKLRHFEQLLLRVSISAKKKCRMRILSAHIFPVFGGKKKIETDVTKEKAAMKKSKI